MGNCLLRCFSRNSDDHDHRYSYSPPRRVPQNLDPHGVTQATVGVAALASDLFNFEITSQVPEGLNPYVVSSKKAQANWYKKLLEAWREARPVPTTPEVAATLVAQTLRRNRTEDVEGILAYYGLPPPLPLPPETSSQPESSSSSSSSRRDGVQFEFYTLPVDAKAVGDGDGMTVYVDTADPRESKDVPLEVQEAAIERTMARAERDYKRADSLLKSINEAGYRFMKTSNGEETLVRKHRIRLRGIDAPECPQPFGKEAKEELIKLTEGKGLKIQVYNTDQYGRLVSDVYCNGMFVQEQMLKRGLAVHYAYYDKRPEFAKWEREAKAARRGLWASSDPEDPRDWRKRNDGWRGKNNIPLQVY